MMFDECDLHIPHKEWASDDERSNYLELERFAQALKQCYGSDTGGGGGAEIGPRSRFVADGSIANAPTGYSYLDWQARKDSSYCFGTNLFPDSFDSRQLTANAGGLLTWQGRVRFLFDTPQPVYGHYVSLQMTINGTTVLNGTYASGVNNPSGTRSITSQYLPVGGAEVIPPNEASASGARILLFWNNGTGVPRNLDLQVSVCLVPFLN